MKVVKLLSLLFVAAFIFSACNNETAEPTINWDGNLSKTMDFALETEYLIDLDVAVNAEAGIKSFVINKYVYEGEDYSTVEITGPAGYVDEIDYTYNFTYTVDETDFPAGVTQIVFEFEVIDNEDRAVTKEFTVFNSEYFTLTFDVKDAFGNDVANAIITFDGIAYEAGDYVIDLVAPGTYGYTVEKQGYETVTITDYEVTANATVDVVLNQNIVDAWIGDVILAVEGQETWASYNGNAVTEFQSTVIGVAYTYTNAGIGRITPTDNCEGYVVVNDISEITNYYTLTNSYLDGSAVQQIDFNVDEVRAYEEMYFISKVDGDYVLVHYKFGQRSPTTGNVLGFEYKTKAE
ncbi:MAG TPA: carboxypeptidase-like regulatory domain-containing protein [Bacteroidales bacterium]|nr:carboxypeptidase-like regulatory domain-containing protein [Bacteroidales bacterium]